MNINKAFEKWSNIKYKNKEGVDNKVSFTAGYKQSRIDFAGEIKKKWLNQDFAENGAEDIIAYIDTELNLKKVE